MCLECLGQLPFLHVTRGELIHGIERHPVLHVSFHLSHPVSYLSPIGPLMQCPLYFH